jgi:hypothetical protein
MWRIVALRFQRPLIPPTSASDKEKAADMTDAFWLNGFG